ncbi:nickel transporter permease [Desulfosediminicola ganghwensis]|uniref:nickel transporter permease n=1 Tax=Desulfosediminicola ganghwensis TaxID=2569540 RepID=UPI0010ABE252|nr:nickel transporter permease [Desulfosediminicola ganghwensis]
MTGKTLRLDTVRSWLLTDTPTSPFHAAAGRTYLISREFLKNHLAVLGLLIILTLITVALFAPLLAPFDPVQTNLTNRLMEPSAVHWMGTDEVGRDILSRIIWGSRLTLYIVGLVAIIAAPVGILIGTVSGYFGGIIDTVLMRITDIFLAFPKLILALAFVAALGPGIENAVIAIAITSWPPYARIARGETITLRNSDFIKAVRLQGAGPVRIITKHIVPLCMSSLIVRVTLDMAGIIMTAAGLGFLGLGAQPPSPEWGAMTASGRAYILDHWWLITMPGMAIFMVSLAFNLLGDGLREVLDPRSEK